MKKDYIETEIADLQAYIKILELKQTLNMPIDETELIISKDLLELKLEEINE